MLNYLKDILNRLAIPKPAHPLVIQAFSKIKKEEIIKVLSLYKDENSKYEIILNKWQFINHKYHINKYLGDLLFSLLMCKKLEELYKKHNLSNKLFLHTMKCISYNVVECKLVKKKWGIFVAYWYDNFYSLSRFAFGRLQIETSTFGLKYKKFNKDTKCLCIHIPRTGEPLNPKAVDQSLKEAIKFFKYKTPILFKCESWLLFDKTIELSDPSSNIYKFSKRFKIIKQITDKDNSEMWRLFDEEIVDLNKLNPNSSLRSGYLNYLINGGRPGRGIGFFIK